MSKRYIFATLTLAILLMGCREDISKHPGYTDTSHVRIFGVKGEHWWGLDITETPDGRYVVVGEAVIHNSNDPISSAVAISISKGGDSLWLYRDTFYYIFTSVESFKDGNVAVENLKGIQIMDPSGKPLRRLYVGPTSYAKTDIFTNDAIIYDPRTDAIVSFYGDSGLCMKQVSVSGQHKWTTCSGVSAFGSELALTDRGYVALGETVGGLLLFEVDTGGNLLWLDTLKIPQEYTDPGTRTFLTGLSLTDDGGFMVAGRTIITVGWYPYIIKLDSNREVEWIKLYNKPGDELDNWDGYPMDLLKLKDGMYVMIGPNRTCPGGYCGAMVRVDAQGNVLRARNYFMWVGSMDFWNGIVDSDGNVVVTGATVNREEGSETSYIFVFKFTPDGEPVWK